LNTTNGMDALDNRTKDILNILQKGSVCGLSILRIPLHTNILCKSPRVHEWLDQK